MSTACACSDIRTEARFNTGLLDPEPIAVVAPFTAAAIAAVETDIRRKNAESANPNPVCRDCNFVIHPNDMEWFFHNRLCTSCGMTRVDNLLYKIARRHGRKATWKLLKRLAK